MRRINFSPTDPSRRYRYTLTWQELDEDIEIEYGVSTPPGSNNPWVVLSHEYVNLWNDTKKSRNWRHKFMYVFGPPGWSHDGSTKTVKQMRAELKEEKKVVPMQREDDLMPEMKKAGLN